VVATSTLGIASQPATLVLVAAQPAPAPAPLPTAEPSSAPAQTSATDEPASSPADLSSETDYHGTITRPPHNHHGAAIEWPEDDPLLAELAGAAIESAAAGEAGDGAALPAIDACTFLPAFCP